MTKKIVLITGATSGLGLALTKKLSKEYRVISTYRDEAKAKAAFNNLDITPIKLDIQDKEDQKRALLQIEKEFGFVDIVINNAGINCIGFFEDLSESEIENLIQTNFLSLIHFTKRVLKLLEKSCDPKLLFIGSTGVYSPLPMQSIYQASKWGLKGFCKSLRLEVKKIKVVLIEPGPFYSKMLTSLPICKKVVDKNGKYTTQTLRLIACLNKYLRHLHFSSDDLSIRISKIINKKNPSFNYVFNGSFFYKLKFYLLRFFPYSILECCFKFYLKG